MIKKCLTILLLVITASILSGCAPPFYDGGITANTAFLSDVRYTTFTIDEEAQGGYIEDEEQMQCIEDYTDGDEQNIPLLQYKRISFTSAVDGVALTQFAFILQADDTCYIEMSVYYGEDLIASGRYYLTRNEVTTVYFSGLEITLSTAKKLSVVITNPLEIGARRFRTDSYIFVSQGS